MARTVIFAIGLTALLVAAISRAATRSFAQLEDDVVRVFGPGRARRVGSEVRASASSDSPFVKWEGTVIPDSWWRGGKTVSLSLATSADQQAIAFELVSATDEDRNGRVDRSEWTLLSTSPTSTWLGRTVASIPPTHIDSDAVAWRVVVRYRDQGAWCPGWYQRGLTYDDP